MWSFNLSLNHCKILNFTIRQTVLFKGPPKKNDISSVIFCERRHFRRNGCMSSTARSRKGQIHFGLLPSVPAPFWQCCSEKWQLGITNIFRILMLQFHAPLGWSHFERSHQEPGQGQAALSLRRCCRHGTRRHQAASSNSCGTNGTCGLQRH